MWLENIQSLMNYTLKAFLKVITNSYKKPANIYLNYELVPEPRLNDRKSFKSFDDMYPKCSIANRRRKY